MAGTIKQNKRFKKSTGYTQHGHPHKVTGCGRRRAYMHKKK